ncbi:MAG: hypothetical protein AB7P37_08430 [Ramlibacter sp.]
MIALERQRHAIPAKYRGDKLQELLDRLALGYYEFNGKIPFNTQKSRFQQWKQAKPALVAESHNKCAYCESPTSMVAHGDVEHFRPKDIYWWLAFSYDNYTYCCQLCNQKFKGANFPVSGNPLKVPVKFPRNQPATAKLRGLAQALCLDPATDNHAALRSLFKAEGAHLPHPYLDEPEKLFAWEADDANREVRLIPNGNGAAARRAVEAATAFLGLNRQDLARLRYAQYSLVQAHALVIQASNQAAVRQLALNALQTAARADQPYAGMTRYFLRTWGILEK